MTQFVQRQYNTWQQNLRPGMIALPRIPYRFAPQFMKAGAPTGRTKPRPGYGLFFDASEDDWRVPLTEWEQLMVTGMASYDPADIQKFSATTPAGSNSNAFLEYDDDDIIKVAVEGGFAGLFGEDAVYGDKLVFNAADGEWVKLSVSQGDALPTGADRVNGAVFQFDAAATGLTNMVDVDASTALTTAVGGDMVRWDTDLATDAWVKVAPQFITQMGSAYCASRSVEDGAFGIVRFTGDIRGL